MNRPLAFLGAVLFAAIAVSSACIARTNPDAISFELSPRSTEESFSSRCGTGPTGTITI